MKYSGYIISACFCAASATASAQSNVTLYGLISTGVAYVSNEGGHSNFKMVSGPLQPSRWGLRGTEDLGGGSKAVFLLENGFSSTDGTLGQNGRMFGRQAYVGLSNDQFGTITLGRQYDAIPTSLAPFESAVQWAAFATHIGDVDNVFNSFRINNSIKYTSPNYGGLSFSALYGASNKAGASKDNSAYSAGVTYASDRLKLGMAYTEINQPGSADNTAGAVVGDYGAMFKTSLLTPGAGVQKQRIFGAGGLYGAGPVRVGLLFTDTRFRYTDTTTLRVDNYELNVSYSATPALLLGAGYIFTTGKYDAPDNASKWHQVNLGGNYFLSKRTTLFLVGIYQRAAGDAKSAAIFALPASSGRSQFALTTGIRHTF